MTLSFFPAKCKKCDSVGTIVEMGKCCLVRRWYLMGPLWEIQRGLEPPPPARRRRLYRHTTRSQSE